MKNIWKYPKTIFFILIYLIIYNSKNTEREREREREREIDFT